MPYVPPVGFHFRVEFSFLPGRRDETLFQEVGGLSAELEVEELAEGGENRFKHRLPVRGSYRNLVLKRGMFASSELIGWVRNAVEALEVVPGQFEPATVNVTLLDEQSQPVGGTYSFLRCWPVKWSLSDLKSSDNAYVVESFELSYQFFRQSS
jgi:phage tail-like protein